jgi:hypothetical protein
MKMLRVLILALSVLVVPLAGQLAADAGRVITGELVAIKGTANQFRIVGHGGTFTAPASASVQALDGKTVEVALSSNGKVAQITEATVPIDPVAHGFSTVRGELVATDPAARRFTFATDNQVYVAPAGIEITAYAGKMVEAKLDEDGRVTELRLVGPGPQTYYPVPASVGSCMYYGQTYSAGSAVCQSGTQYRCDGSQWQSLGVTCQRADARDARDTSVPPRAPRSCVVGDATVASGSGICRSGTTYRCDDGAWINVQTACR